MNRNTWFLATIMVIASSATGVAQTLSGLSVKERIASPEESPRDEASLRRELRASAIRSLLSTKDLTGRERVTLRAELKFLEETKPSVNLAVPVGATASVDDSEPTSAGPVLGFQAWKPDDFFAGAFFTLDATHAISGDARAAAAFLRDPPAAGTSFVAAGSWMFLGYGGDGFNTLRFTFEGESITRDLNRDAVLFGLGFRGGVTTATFEHAGESGAVSRDALIFHATPSLLITSRTFRTDNSGEYQFGMELGWTFRGLGGDAARDRAFLASSDVLGHDDTAYDGFEGRFFLRLNAFQPFIRVTRMSAGRERHIDGLTGTQATFGVTIQSALLQTVQERSRR